MKDAHRDSCHRGRDGTLSRFRYQFWTTKGTSLANRVKRECQLCRLRYPQFFEPEDGSAFIGKSVLCSPIHMGNGGSDWTIPDTW